MRTLRVNLTIAADVAKEARAIADQRGIALSRLVERALIRLLQDLGERYHEVKGDHKEQRRAA